MTLLQKLDRIPPFLCIAIATGRKGGMNMVSISILSAVPLRTIERISTLTSWGGVKLDTIDRIAGTCGVNLINPGSALRYLKKTIQSRNPLPMLGSVQRQAFNRRFAEWKKSASGK